MCANGIVRSRARARADERRNGRPDVVSRNVQTSETEHFRTNVSYRPSAHRATGITAATSHTGAGTTARAAAGDTLQMEDRAFVKSR